MRVEIEIDSICSTSIYWAFYVFSLLVITKNTAKWENVKTLTVIFCDVLSLMREEPDMVAYQIFF